MYGVELYAAVRLAVVDEGLSHHEAARRFGIDRRTVKKMLSYSAPPRRQIIPPPLTCRTESQSAAATSGQSRYRLASTRSDTRRAASCTESRARCA